MHSAITRIILLELLLGLLAPLCFGYEELVDDQLDAITAGTASVTQDGGLLYFDFSHNSGHGLVNGSGSLAVPSSSITDTTIGALNLSDSAQGNLHSLININAVNSPVQVLMNLTVNVNSTIGSLRQINLNNRIP
jgi:hypothetical protein